MCCFFKMPANSIWACTLNPRLHKFTQYFPTYNIKSYFMLPTHSRREEELCKIAWKINRFSFYILPTSVVCQQYSISIVCILGVKVQNMKMDINTGGTWSRFEQRTLMMKRRTELQCWVGRKILVFGRSSVILKQSRSVFGHQKNYFGPNSVIP